MNKLFFTFSLFGKVFGVLYRRSLGIKKYPNWSMKTEMIWATTRMTLLASNRFGLEWLKELSQKFSPKPSTSKGVEVKEEYILGIRLLKITPVDTVLEGTSMLYFHGGGYVLGSPEASLHFAIALSLASRSTIYVPDYPKAPEAHYPQAQISSLDLIKWMVKSHHSVFLMGDSAGAALVLSSYTNLTAKERKNVMGTILVSPWTAPLSSKESINFNSDNDVGDRSFVTNCYRLYLGDGAEKPEYPMSFNATNLPTLPKTFISIGTAEILLDQSQELKYNLTNLGSEVSLKLYKNMFHTFWNQTATIPEASQLIDDISVWLKTN